jgi:RNA polymerase sigma-70 factor (ECF subfamily)
MDTDLVVRSQQGEEVAFGRLVTTVADRMHRLAYSILGDRHLAEDAIQRALVDIWRDLPTLRDPAHFDAWSYRILVRACYAQARNERRWSRGRIRTTIEPLIEDGSASLADRDQLEHAFDRLSLDHRTVIVLHHYLGLPLREVAEVLGIKTGTAHSRHHHAVRSLRAALAVDERPARPIQLTEEVSS